MSKRQIGAQLVAARIKRDVTQAQLSKELGVSQEMIAMIERGTKNPGKSLATRIESWISGGSHSEDAPRGARGSYEKVAARIRKRTR